MLVTKQEIAEELQLSVSMVNKLMKIEKNPIPFLKIGKSVRFDKQEVAIWIKERGRE